MGKPKRAQKPMERRRLGPTAGRYTTPFIDYANPFRRLSPPPIEIKLPPRLMLALQVREDTGKEWGNLRAFSINIYTPHDQKSKLTKELKYLEGGWMASGYFGGGASFRIKEVLTKAEEVSY